MYRVKKYGFWAKQGQKHKYNAKSGYCLSEHFHRSGLETRVCDELRLRKIAKEIKDFKVEVNIPLSLEGLSLGIYRADFLVEHNDGTQEIIEAKGMMLPVFRQKWKILEHMNKDNPNIKLTLVRK